MNELISNKSLIFQGAESRVYEVEYMGFKAILKHRFQKSYRQVQLDRTLRISRTAAEVKNTARCKLNGINCPLIYYADCDHGLIIMEYISGETLKEYLDSNQDISEEKLQKICLNIGNSIARLHSCVIHGDLTSSNIIITNNKLDDDVIIQFIDFGLSYCETLAEDMAVDLYVLERSLQVAHSNNCLIDFILKAYSSNHPNGEQIIRRLNQGKLLIKSL
ncbi:putative TP53-regulating kinase [Cryptosporidium serpentis]